MPLHASLRSWSDSPQSVTDIFKTAWVLRLAPQWREDVDDFLDHQLPISTYPSSYHGPGHICNATWVGEKKKTYNKSSTCNIFFLFRQQIPRKLLKMSKHVTQFDGQATPVQLQPPKVERVSNPQELMDPKCYAVKAPIHCFWTKRTT